MKEFFQEAPTLGNTFKSDETLRAYLKKNLFKESSKEVMAHLDHVGDLACGPWLEWSLTAEKQGPQWVPFDPWGRKIDDISMPEAWKNLEAAAAAEGVIATAYERKWGPWSRVYQMALLYLFHPSSAFVSCPLAMTDGAARALELYGSKSQKSRAFKHLTSRNPKEFWISGQWMTERSGGSDVSGTETVAKKEGNNWTLSGTKWFTSATTSQVAMTLARPEGAESGSRGLSLFYVETRSADDRLKSIEVLRLKNKLGTRAMPTAELRLNETPAELVGGLGHGVRKISSLFNLTRVYNSICALGHMRRALDWAQSYSRVRKAFGRRISEQPAHRFLLSELEKIFSDCFKLSFFVVELLGKDETGEANEKEKTLLRALTPIVKLYTGKKVMEITSEVVEIFGGAGYIEDTGIPTLLRDAQVFSIWEGTTNVLALDFLRSVEKEDSLPVLLEHLKKNKVQLSPRFQEFLTWAQKGQKEKLETHARELAFLVATHVIQSIGKP